MLIGEQMPWVHPWLEARLLPESHAPATLMFTPKLKALKLARLGPSGFPHLFLWLALINILLL